MGRPDKLTGYKMGTHLARINRSIAKLDGLIEDFLTKATGRPQDIYHMIGQTWGGLRAIREASDDAQGILNDNGIPEITQAVIDELRAELDALEAELNE